MDKEKQEKFDLQTNDLYRAYGRFAVNFEHMCSSIRTCILFAFQLQKQELLRVLLADQTADPLIKKLRAIISIIFRKKAEEIKHIDPLFKFCISIIEKRNEIIHGTWFIGWASSEQTEFDSANGKKDKIKSEGVKTYSFYYKAETFDDLTEKVIIAKNLLDRLGGVFNA